MENHNERPSFFGPILLIILGLVFLLGNLGVLQGDLWGTLLRLWPLLFVIAGLDSLFRAQGVAGPVFLLALGGIFLLGNFGYLAVNAWTFLLRLWPLLLIVGGLDLIIGRRSLWISLATTALVLVTLAAAIWSSGALRLQRGAAVQGRTLQQPLGDFNRALVVIDPGLGSLQINALRDSELLVEGQVPENQSGNIREDFSIRQGTGVYRLGGSYFNIFPFNTDAGALWTWSLGLNDQLPIQLEVELGAGELDLDLEALVLSEVNISLGVGDVSVRLPASGSYDAVIDGGIGQINLLVPEDMAVRIEADVGIGAVDAPPGFETDGDRFISPAYSSAGEGVDVIVDLGIGAINLEVVP